MNTSESKVPERVKMATESLVIALEYIDSIQRKDRTEEVNNLLSTAADLIDEAKEALEKVNTSQYSNFYNGENVRINPLYIKKGRMVEKVFSTEG